MSSAELHNLNSVPPCLHDKDRNAVSLLPSFTSDGTPEGYDSNVTVVSM
jgi:hypothetical protein